MSAERVWTDEIPTEVGFYWFYGEPWLGSMGTHYKADYQLEPKMYLVRIFNIKSGRIAKTEGQMISLRKFDTKLIREGVRGKWSKAELPDAPEL